MKPPECHIEYFEKYGRFIRLTDDWQVFWWCGYCGAVCFVNEERKLSEWVMPFLAQEKP